MIADWMHGIMVKMPRKVVGANIAYKLVVE
jgi:hypothetical protein